MRHSFKSFAAFILASASLHFIAPLNNALAQACAPVLNGALINVAPECLNDSTALTFTSASADASGWQCENESAEDGVTFGTVGGGTFEIYGIAVKETDLEIAIVIKSNLPITGFSHSSAADNNIGWGDLFFNLNFPPTDFEAASAANSLYAIKFADTNDSGAAQTGVYEKVSAKSVVAENAGFANYLAYVNHVISKSKIPDLGSLNHPQTYYANDLSSTVIDQGTYIGPITFLDSTELAALNSSCVANLSGAHTIAFKFEKRLIIDECGVLGGDGSSCRDCFGNMCGTAKMDQCGICGGDGQSCLDCKGVPFGTAVVDQCNVCDGDGTSCLD
ncbi:MAG: hypothetical protein J5J00_09265, partial [Deltaproteobacteria bacterium]|nr:hypothetical protein [Deltaproteobacteria bacterium]